MQLPHRIFISKLVEICFAILWLYSKPEILNSLKSSNNFLGYLLLEKLTHAMSMYMLLSCTNLLTKFEGFPDGNWETICLPLQEMRVRSLGQEDPWGKEWQPLPVFLPGKRYGWRSLAGYSPQGCKSRSWLSDETTLTKFTIQASVVPVTEKSAELILVQMLQRQALGLASHHEPWGCSHEEPYLWPTALGTALPLLLWPLPL